MTVLTDRMWSVRSGRRTQDDALLLTTESCEDLQAEGWVGWGGEGGGGLTEVSRPAESSKAAFFSRIQL